MKYGKSAKLLLIAASIAVLSGCATNSARESDERSREQHNEATSKGQQTAELSTIKRAQAAVQNHTLFDREGNIMAQLQCAGNYEVAKAPVFAAPASEVQAMIDAQKVIVPAAMQSLVTVGKIVNDSFNTRYQRESNERIAVHNNETNERIEQGRNELLRAVIAQPAITNPLTSISSNDSYPCPVRSDAGEFVAGSPTDGWGENPADGACVDLVMTTEDPDDEDPVVDPDLRLIPALGTL